jgi:hypothetical protein
VFTSKIWNFLGLVFTELQLVMNSKVILTPWRLVRKDMDVNEHERLYNITLGHRSSGSWIFVVLAQLNNSAPLIHISLTLSQPFFAFGSSCFILSREAANTNFSLWFIQSIKMSDIIKDHIREHTHLSCKCGRSWISFLVVSNQRLKLVFAASLLNI